MRVRPDERVRNQVILCQDGSPFIPQYPGGIDLSRCTGCGECVEVCPQGCIELRESEDGRKIAVIVDLDPCIGDGICRIVCPEDAFL